MQSPLRPAGTSDAVGLVDDGYAAGISKNAQHILDEYLAGTVKTSSLDLAAQAAALYRSGLRDQVTARAAEATKSARIAAKLTVDGYAAGLRDQLTTQAADAAAQYRSGLRDQLTARAAEATKSARIAAKLTVDGYAAEIAKNAQHILDDYLAGTTKATSLDSVTDSPTQPPTPEPATGADLAYLAWAVAIATFMLLLTLRISEANRLGIYLPSTDRFAVLNELDFIIVKSVLAKALTDEILRRRR